MVRKNRTKNPDGQECERHTGETDIINTAAHQHAANDQLVDLETVMGINRAGASAKFFSRRYTCNNNMQGLYQFNHRGPRNALHRAYHMVNLI